MKRIGLQFSCLGSIYVSAFSGMIARTASRSFCGATLVQKPVEAGMEGYSKYVVASNTIERAYTPLSEHSDPNELKKWIPLTSTTETRSNST